MSVALEAQGDTVPMRGETTMLSCWSCWLGLRASWASRSEAMRCWDEAETACSVASKYTCSVFSP